MAHVYVQPNVTLAEQLLAEGLGSVHFSASRYPEASRLGYAEDAAKSKRLGVWANYDPAAEAAKAAAAGQQEIVVDKKERTTNYKPATLSYIVDSTTVCLQASESAGQLSDVMAEINAHFAKGVRAGVYTPKKGERVAAIFAGPSATRRRRKGRRRRRRRRRRRMEDGEEE